LVGSYFVKEKDLYRVPTSDPLFTSNF